MNNNNLEQVSNQQSAISKRKQESDCKVCKSRLENKREDQARDTVPMRSENAYRMDGEERRQEGGRLTEEMNNVQGAEIPGS